MTMSSTRDERWKMARETGSREREREKCRLTIATLALRRAGKREREKKRGKKKRNKARISPLPGSKLNFTGSFLNLV